MMIQLLKKRLIWLYLIGLSLTLSCNSAHMLQEKEVQWAEPVLQYYSSLFQDSVVVKLLAPCLFANYTTDGSLPIYGSEKLMKPITIKESCVLKVKMNRAPMQSSEVVEVEFLKLPEKIGIQDIQLLQKPSGSYPGTAAALIDQQKGSLNFRENVWMGFDRREVEIELSCSQAEKLTEVVLSTLKDHDSWIFLPEKIEVITPKDTIVASWEIPTEAETAKLAYLHIPLDEIETQKFRIRITMPQKIPDWHPGAGHQPWLFIDEIIMR